MSDSGMSDRGIAQGKADGRAIARWRLLLPGFDACPPPNSLFRAIARRCQCPLDATTAPPMQNQPPMTFKRQQKALRKRSRLNGLDCSGIWANAPDGTRLPISSKRCSCVLRAASRRDPATPVSRAAQPPLSPWLASKEHHSDRSSSASSWCLAPRADTER